LEQNPQHRLYERQLGFHKYDRIGKRRLSPYFRINSYSNARARAHGEAHSVHRLVNGVNTSFDAYNISDNNYFKLRDIGEAFDFGVDWDGAAKTTVIDTSKGYTPE
jgi:hypothetical protein